MREVQREEDVVLLGPEANLRRRSQEREERGIQESKLSWVCDAPSVLRGRWERRVRGVNAKYGIPDGLVYSRGDLIVLRIWKEKKLN